MIGELCRYSPDCRKYLQNSPENHISVENP